MHLNKQQPQEQHDCIPNSNEATSLTSNGNANPITTRLTAHTEKFTGSSASCTSSTDSGVHMSDNETTINTNPPSPPPPALPPPLDPFSEQFPIKQNNTSADNKTNKSSGKSAEAVGRPKSCTIFGNESTSEQLYSGNEYDCPTSPYQSNRNAINNENVIKYHSHRPTMMSGEQRPTVTTSGANTNQSPEASLRFNDHTRAETPASSTISSSESLEEPPSRHHYNRSPAVSICSINSSVIDSDSDSDLNGDLEGVHENYVIKKLGTQVSYPPKHPDIPKINNGLKVVNHQITPNGTGANGLAAPSPLDILANMGDNMAQVQSLGQAPCVSHRPQIAVSSSKDITIGDKHFYEGPVTIQQFLIDSRDKWKDSNGTDNPTFEHDETHNYAKDKNSSPAASANPYMKILQRRKYIIPGVLAVIALIVLAIVFGIEASSDNKSKNVLGNSEESRKNIPISSTIAHDNVGGGHILRIVPRDGWLAQPPINPLVALNLPVERVIVIPTRTTNCETQAACTYTVRFTQTFNIESQQQDDIIYNFLIGGDGNVYEGRGWDNRPSAVQGFNDDSIILAYIGSFNKQKPSDKQLNVTKLLLNEGVRLHKLSKAYRIVGAHTLDPASTAASADALYESFKNWPHWSDH